jgi:NhaP-type Na+/H+ or K+/H+ antiporter
MSLTHTVSLVLSILVGVLLGLVTWGFLRLGHRRSNDDDLEPRDEVLYGLLAFSVFSLGAFVTYILILSCWM